MTKPPWLLHSIDSLKAAWPGVVDLPIAEQAEYADVVCREAAAVSAAFCQDQLQQVSA
jgi:hypothetical protein